MNKEMNNVKGAIRVLGVEFGRNGYDSGGGRMHSSPLK